jgi:hypothetical protein
MRQDKQSSSFILRRRKPLINTKTFIKYNKEAKLQNTSVTDLAKEMILLRKEVTGLREKLRKMEEESECSFKIDSWARQEIRQIRDELDSRPQPLEDAPFENLKSSSQLQGLTAMKILPIRFQKYQVKIKLEINSQIFHLNALLDTGSDMNLVHKDLIPHKYWFPSSYSAIGLGNISTDMDFEIPRGILLFDEYALGMKFLLTELPVDCILGTPFLSAVEPHGSCKNSKGDPGYFITLPSINGHPPNKKVLAFISKSHAQVAYCQSASQRGGLPEVAVLTFPNFTKVRNSSC